MSTSDDIEDVIVLSDIWFCLLLILAYGCHEVGNAKGIGSQVMPSCACRTSASCACRGEVAHGPDDEPFTCAPEYECIVHG